jgi:endonuclease/exonuclease/phosphatase family metal-dependent hydrolase
MNRYLILALNKASLFSFLLIIGFSCKKTSFEEVPPEIKSIGFNNNLFIETPSSNKIRVLSFNILAPCWADPSYYPASTAPLLNRLTRRKTIIDLLKSYQNSVDVFALQEVAQSEFNCLKEALKMTHIGFQANHASSYWSNWITPANPWEPNGNAIFVNKSLFTTISFEDFASSGSGNHSALFTATIKNSGGKMIRAASVHLDSDYPYNRKNELGAVLAKWLPKSNNLDIILGDFNTETDATNIQTDIKKAGYNDLLELLGTARQTHPWDSKYYGADNWGIIDHITYRNGSAVSGAVVDFNLFQLYPNNEEARININFQQSGSDHFPLTGVISY